MNSHFQLSRCTTLGRLYFVYICKMEDRKTLFLKTMNRLCCFRSKVSISFFLKSTDSKIAPFWSQTLDISLADEPRSSNYHRCIVKYANDLSQRSGGRGGGGMLLFSNRHFRRSCTRWRRSCPRWLCLRTIHTAAEHHFSSDRHWQDRLGTGDHIGNPPKAICLMKK